MLSLFFPLLFSSVSALFLSREGRVGGSRDTLNLVLSFKHLS